MNDEEKIKSFADMVDGIERLTKPTQDENIRLHEQLNKMHQQMCWERVAFSLILALIIALSYLVPVESEQVQRFEEQTQTQSYSEGAANK